MALMDIPVLGELPGSSSKRPQIRSASESGDPGSKKLEAACPELAKGTGVLKTAKLVGLGTGAEWRLKQALMVA